MSLKKRILILLLAIPIYHFIVRPLIFLIHEYIFFPVLGYVALTGSVELADQGRYIFLTNGRLVFGNWALAFGYTTLVLPGMILWLINDMTKLWWLLYIHIGLTALTLFIFLGSLLMIAPAAELNTIVHNYILPGISFGVLAMAFADMAKKMKSTN